MNCQFDILTSVFFRHSYFTNKRFEGLVIKAPVGTLRQLNKMDMLFKTVKDGFRILFNTDFMGRERKKEEVTENPFILRFHLLLETPAFYNYTANVSYDLTKSIFYFTNTLQDTKTPSTHGKLHSEDVVSYKDLHPVEEFEGQSFSKPFGLIDLEIRQGMNEIYDINFLSKSTFWRYILVSDYLNDLSSPGVLDPKNHDFFDGPAMLMLPDERPVVAFTSRDKISLSESTSSPYQLVENYESGTGKYKTVITALPLPDIHVISLAVPTNKQKTQSEFSEIFI